MAVRGETVALPPAIPPEHPGLGNSAPVCRWPRYCIPWERPEIRPGAPNVFSCPVIYDPTLRIAFQPDSFPDPGWGVYCEVCRRRCSRGHRASGERLANLHRCPRIPPPTY